MNLPVQTYLPLFGTPVAPACPPPDSNCLFVVACSQRKHPDLKQGLMMAQDAYTGQCFKLARRWCSAHRVKWCILSGFYGFLWPDTQIEFYDQKMEPLDERDFMAFDAIKQKQYGRLWTATRVIVLGSRLYADGVAGLLERKVEAPLAGLPIGKMLASLSRADFFTFPPSPSILEKETSF